LKEIREKKEDKASLPAWNEQLIEYGKKIIGIRFFMLKKVNSLVKKIYRDLAGGQEEITLRYGASLMIDYTMPEQEIGVRFRQGLEEVQREEIARGQSIIGPHRDELIFLINGKEIRLYGSQGQHRSLILALKLTLAQIWYNEIGEYPILLLDDVLSELDENRQKALLTGIINKAQIFITTSVFTDLKSMAGTDKSTFTVEKGLIIT
jgi:DNA replication and repair protein RecF